MVKLLCSNFRIITAFSGFRIFTVYLYKHTVSRLTYMIYTVCSWSSTLCWLRRTPNVDWLLWQTVKTSLKDAHKKSIGSYSYDCWGGGISPGASPWPPYPEVAAFGPSNIWKIGKYIFMHSKFELLYAGIILRQDCDLLFWFFFPKLLHVIINSSCKYNNW